MQFLMGSSSVLTSSDSYQTLIHVSRPRSRGQVLRYRSISAPDAIVNKENHLLVLELPARNIRNC